MDYGSQILQQELQQTLQAYRSFVAPSPLQALSPDVQKDWNLASGFQPYNLLPVALVLVPQLTPIRNMTPRTSGKGAKSEYKSVTALNTANVQGWVAEGSAATIVTTATTDNTATYKSSAWADKVTFEQQWAGRTFVDTKALAVVNLLRASMIAEENNEVFGQANGSANVTEQGPGAVGTPANPTLGTAAGGTIVPGTYWIRQTVLTGMGESTSSTGVTIVTAATGSITVTPVFPANQPVVGFKLYWSATQGGTYSEILGTDLATAFSVGILPGGTKKWYTNGQLVTATALNTGNASFPTVDASSSALAYNGLYAQMFGGTGATLQKVNGALTTAALATFFTNMWTNYRGDPDAGFANAIESQKITSMTLGNGTPYYVVVNQTDGATANFRVARYTNPVTGTEVPIKVHPTIPQGTLLFLSTRMPAWYVPTEVPNVFDLNLPQDYVEIDYPPTQAAPYWQVEIRLYGAMRVFIPGLLGALYGLNNQ